ncbi:hypothetical protein GQ44DRAFT_622857 [Phaeosphaeriaceae sp. PMI808]|nr:hypothetical protein GQ44DRAFT_622857 [Phaeosphaeriaceae sp. PMI808]
MANRPNFKPVDYLEWRAKWKRQRAAAPSDLEIADFTNIEVIQQEESSWAVIARMATVYPLKDMTWVVAVMFAVGSLVFTINAFFGLLPLVIPSTQFETNATVAIPATILIGGSLFVIAGFLSIPASINARRGSLNIEKLPEGATAEYRPALVGSKEWVWFLPSSELKDITLHNRPFQAGLIQVVGGMILSISAVAGTPGVVDPMSPIFPTLVFWPQVIGGAMFALANLMLVISEQEKWYKPKPLNAAWQGAFQSFVGGFGFMITGVFLLQGAILESAVAAFGGSWAFFIGSLIQWYIVMQIY